MHVEYHPYLFNPLFWHISKYLKDPNIRYIYVYGGSSAAKTYSIVQALQIYQMQHECNVMVYRKESTTIDESVYADYKIVGQQLEFSHLKYIEKEVRESSKKYKTVFKGLDDPEKTKGLSSYQFVYMNEVSKFDQEDFDEVERRLRGRPNQKIIADWNPIADDHWIKVNAIDKTVDDVPQEKWRDLPLYVEDAPTKYTALDAEFSSVQINESGNSILIKTTYRDNYWVVGHPKGEPFGYYDKHTIEKFNEYKRLKNTYYYDVYANGNWGHLRTGAEFFDEFDKSVHVSYDNFIDKDRSVVITFDFNRLPYSTCLCLQKHISEDGKVEIRQFDEICLKPTHNTIEDIYDEFMYRHPWVKTVYFCGDPSGRSKGQRKSRDEADSYEEMITVAFNNFLHNRSNIFLRSAPPLAKRKRAMDVILSDSRVRYRVYHTCINTIKDFQTLQIDRTGGYIKKKVTDKKTGATYEDGGHCMDALIYYLSVELKDLFF